jgi:hypothetical protein
MEPLRELNEGEKETTAKMMEDAAQVAELFEKFTKKMHSRSGKGTTDESGDGIKKRNNMEKKAEDGNDGRGTVTDNKPTEDTPIHDKGNSKEKV